MSVNGIMSILRAACYTRYDGRTAERKGAVLILRDRTQGESSCRLLDYEHCELSDFGYAAMLPFLLDAYTEMEYSLLKNNRTRGYKMPAITCLLSINLQSNTFEHSTPASATFLPENMFSIAKVASFAVAGLGLVGTAAAAPVHNATALVARGPYDTHNGW
ncbi:hypothetical protein FS749_012781, partial [Ceratobasidium sp. UAMH 11750]